MSFCLSGGPDVNCVLARSKYYQYVSYSSKIRGPLSISSAHTLATKPRGKMPRAANSLRS